ncbi:hypothetical protein ACSBR2_030005 [Camellia fascicularis]
MNIAINLQAPFQFDDVVGRACEKFDGLTPADVCLFFKIPDYNNFTLQNDVDVENMVCLARCFRLQCIDVLIQVEQLNSEVFFASMRSSVASASNMSKMILCESQLWNREHICGVAVWTPKNPRASSDLVSDVISERVRDKPLTRPTGVVYDLKKDYRLEVSYWVAWLGVEKAHREMFGAHSILFDQLQWYSSVVMENNPGSYINIEYDEQNNHFIRWRNGDLAQAWPGVICPKMEARLVKAYNKDRSWLVSQSNDNVFEVHYSHLSWLMLTDAHVHVSSGKSMDSHALTQLWQSAVADLTCTN